MMLGKRSLTHFSTRSPVAGGCSPALAGRVAIACSLACLPSPALLIVARIAGFDRTRPRQASGINAPDHRPASNMAPRRKTHYAGRQRPGMPWDDTTAGCRLDRAINGDSRIVSEIRSEMDAKRCFRCNSAHGYAMPGPHRRNVARRKRRNRRRFEKSFQDSWETG
jgi:hypothetical protein